MPTARPTHLSNKSSAEARPLILALREAVLNGEWEKIKQLGMAGNKLDDESIEKALKHPDIANAPPEVINWLTYSKNSTYADLCNKDHSPLLQARALLHDYSKNNSALGRFFGHLKRKNDNLQLASTLVREIDQGIIKSGEELLAKLEKFAPENKTGSFARRIQYICSEIFPEINRVSDLHTQSQQAFKP